MDKELFTQVFPVLTAFAGGILGFLANLLVNRIEYSRQLKRDKEEHLKELYDEFAIGITSLLHFVEEMIELLRDIEGEKLSKKREEEIQKEIEKLIGDFDSQLLSYNSLSAKFNFVRVIDFGMEFEQLTRIYMEFSDFAYSVDEKGDKIPIGDEEAKFLNELSNKHDQLSDIILTKMEAFYSIRYLPKK